MISFSKYYSVPVAQLVERAAVNREVVGSSPARDVLKNFLNTIKLYNK